MYRLAPTRKQADELLDRRLTAEFKADANDNLYQWESSGDFDPAAHVEKIKARVLAINSEDDERNPPSLGLMNKILPRIPDAKLYLIPASSQTSGHGTTGQAKLWKDQLDALLKDAPTK